MISIWWSEKPNLQILSFVGASFIPHAYSANAPQILHPPATPQAQKPLPEVSKTAQSRVNTR